ncbi:MAG: hypothetical protein E3J72_08245 [Planctomycetota bacterium]|nr:MAG: hypothetical protein E3J72_08245 [Planctomycetota bacterium]
MGCQAETTFNPGEMDGMTTYYWRIDTYNTFGNTTGNIWSFRTCIKPGSLNWVRQAGGVNDDYAYGIDALPDGSTFVTGDYEGVVTFGEGDDNETTLGTESCSSAVDIFVAKYNPDGTLAWAKFAGGNNWDTGYGIAALVDGTVFVSGTIEGNAVFGFGELNQTILTTSNDQNIFLARYNPDGKLAWARHAGGPGPDYCYTLSATPDGCPYIAGSFYGSNSSGITFAAGEPEAVTLYTNSPIDGYMLYIAKYFGNGTLAWAKNARGPDSGMLVWSEAYGIDTLSDGSAWLTGYFLNEVWFGIGEGNEEHLTSEFPLGPYDGEIFLARYSSDGTLAWAKGTLGRIVGNTNKGYGVSVLPDGKAYVTGFINGSTIFGLGESNEIMLNSTDLQDNLEMFIALYNSSGDLEWARSGGSSGEENGYSVAVFGDNSAYVTGCFSSLDNAAIFGADDPHETALHTGEECAMFVARYNIDGTLEWAKSEGYNALAWSWIYNSISTGSSAIFVTGHFNGSPVFGYGEPYEMPLTTYGTNDVFIASFIP